MKLTKIVNIFEPFSPIVATVIVVGATFYLRSPYMLGKTVGTATATGSPTVWTIDSQVQS